MSRTETDDRALQDHGTDVVITPTMIEAGVSVLRRYDASQDVPDDVVREIIERTLEAVRLQAGRLQTSFVD